MASSLIKWEPWALAAFSDAQRAAAERGEETPDVDYVVEEPELPPVIWDPGDPTAGGAKTPEQLFAEGFIYVNGRWVRSDLVDQTNPLNPIVRSGPGAFLDPGVSDGGSGPGSVLVSSIYTDVPSSVNSALVDPRTGMGVVNITLGVAPTGMSSAIKFGDPRNGLGQIRMRDEGW